MKKKFFMYVIVMVTILFLGFTTYYVSKNNENISLTLSREESVYINKTDSFIKENYEIENSKLAVFDEDAVISFIDVVAEKFIEEYFDYFKALRQQQRYCRYLTKNDSVKEI